MSVEHECRHGYPYEPDKKAREFAHPIRHCDCCLADVAKRAREEAEAGPRECPFCGNAYLARASKSGIRLHEYECARRHPGTLAAEVERLKAKLKATEEDETKWYREAVAFRAENERLKGELERIAGLPDQECAEVRATVMQALASAARAGSPMLRTRDALDRGSVYVSRLRAEVDRLKAERDDVRKHLGDACEAAERTGRREVIEAVMGLWEYPGDVVTVTQARDLFRERGWTE